MHSEDSKMFLKLVLLIRLKVGLKLVLLYMSFADGFSYYWPIFYIDEMSFHEKDLVQVIVWTLCLLFFFFSFAFIALFDLICFDFF